jgi:hypothetical protein
MFIKLETDDDHLAFLETLKEMSERFEVDAQNQTGQSFKEYAVN